MKASQRWLVLCTLLVATLGAGAWVESNERNPVVVKPAARSGAGERRDARPAPANAGVASTSVHLEKFGARQLGEPSRDPFHTEDAAPKARKARTARGPTAGPAAVPPVPFAYMGLQRDGGGESVFLAFSDRNLVAREGDTVDSAYRIDEVDEEAITVTYLPLAVRQTVLLGQAQ